MEDDLNVLEQCSLTVLLCSGLLVFNGYIMPCKNERSLKILISDTKLKYVVYGIS